MEIHVHKGIYTRMKVLETLLLYATWILPFMFEALIPPAFVNVDNWEHLADSFSRIALN